MLRLIFTLWIATSAFAVEEPNSFYIGVGSSPDVDGLIVVWENDANIYAKDLATETYLDICTHPAEQYAPKISGNIVIWADTRDVPTGYSGIYSIYGFNLTTQEEFPIAILGDYWYSDIASIDANTVVYSGKIANSTQGGDNIWVYNISEQTEFLIDDIGTTQYPDINKDLVAYYHGSNGLILYNITDSSSESICSTIIGIPRISENVIAWRDKRHGGFALDTAIYAYELETEREIMVCPPGRIPLISVAVGGELIVWAENKDGDRDIYGYDIFVGQEFAICTAAGDQRFPAISGDLVVWAEGNIKGAYLPMDQIRCRTRPQMDFNYDCRVNFKDMALFLSEWLECNLDPPEACWE